MTGQDEQIQEPQAIQDYRRHPLDKGHWIMATIAYIDSLRAQLEEARRERDEIAAWKNSHMHGKCNGFIRGEPPHYVAECEVYKQQLESAESALREATNKALEEAAMECEARNVKRNGYVSRKREEARACAAAIRSLKTPPVDG